MSDSYRKPVLKDKPRNYKRTSLYWRPIRRIINQIVSTYKVKYDNKILDLYYGEDSDALEIQTVEKNSIMLGTELPNPKTIINDYDYCDYKCDYRYLKWWTRRSQDKLKQEQIELSRK